MAFSLGVGLAQQRRHCGHCGGRELSVQFAVCRVKYTRCPFSHGSRDQCGTTTVQPIPSDLDSAWAINTGTLTFHMGPNFHRRFPGAIPGRRAAGGRPGSMAANLVPDAISSSLRPVMGSETGERFGADHRGFAAHTLPHYLLASSVSRRTCRPCLCPRMPQHNRPIRPLASPDNCRRPRLRTALRCSRMWC